MEINKRAEEMTDDELATMLLEAGPPQSPAKEQPMLSAVGDTKHISQRRSQSRISAEK
jgi:hypothetical protein